MVRNGNPRQQKVLNKLKDLGYNPRVKHNQIHIEGVRVSPFYPDDKVPEGQTYGLTIAGALEFIERNHGIQAMDVIHCK